MLARLVVIGSRPDEPPAAGTSATSQSPSFEVRVEKPLSARPLFGLFGLIPADDLAFNHASRGAAIGLVGHDRLKLSAEGWDFSIEIGGEGRVAPGTRLVFPLELGGGQVTLRCRPADHETFQPAPASRRLTGEAPVPENLVRHRRNILRHCRM